MDPEAYASALGKLIANLQSLEYVLRAFLYQTEAAPYVPFPEGYPLYSLRVGDTVPHNGLTSFETLGQLVTRYNQTVGSSAPDLTVDPAVVELRDALAHGRISGALDSEHFTLLKFSKPAKGGAQVEVTYATELTEEWLTERRTWVAAQLRQVYEAGDWHTPE